MRQILIEKYIEPSISKFLTSSHTGKIFFVQRWDNIYGELHGVFDYPAAIWYNLDFQILDKYWYKNGKKHRDRGLPAVIWYDDFGEGIIIRKEWHKNGKFIK
jgi:hypothetical protein